MSDPTPPTEGAAYQTCSAEAFATPARSLGMVAVFFAGLFLFGAVALRTPPPNPFENHLEGGPAPEQLTAIGVALALLLVIPLIILHEWAHGLAFRWAGGAPHFGIKVLENKMVIAYADCTDFRTTCAKYRMILLAPTILVNALGVLLMLPATPLRYLLIFPLACHLSGCTGDWWMYSLLRRVPNDAIIVDIPQGFRYPAAGNQQRSAEWEPNQ